MKVAALVLVLAAAVVTGCGGGGKKQAGGAPAASEPAPATIPATSTPSAAPTATTNTPPKKHRTKPSSAQPLKVTSRYKCNGKPLRAISAAGPVNVKPAIVKPGQSFTVTVTDPTARTAVVSLAGVATKPIQVSAKPSDAHVAATIRMPSYATCGNKLLEVEGDVSAEAYVGVAR